MYDSTRLIGVVVAVPVALAVKATLTLVYIVTPLIVNGAVITGADVDRAVIACVVRGIVIELTAGAVYVSY